MEITEKLVPKLTLAAIEHRGAYHEIGEKFGQIWGWAKQNQVPVESVLGVYYDDPMSTPEAELRSIAAVSVPESFEWNDKSIQRIEMPGGEVLSYTHRGSYEQLGQVWEQFWTAAEGKGRVLQMPCFEIYLNDCEEVGMENALTELCIPVK